MFMKEYKNELKNGVKMDIEYCNGSLQSAIKNNIFMIDDETALYICGKHIVQYNIATKKQQFLLKSTDDQEVTAFNYFITKSDQLLIAVGLKCLKDTTPNVRVYKDKKKGFSHLVHSHLLPNSSIVSLAFVMKGKCLATLSDNMDNKTTMSFWNTQKQNLIRICDFKCELDQILFSSMGQD